MNCRYHRKLARFQLEALSAAEMQQVREHVGSCPACQTRLRELARTSELLSADVPLPEAPAAVWEGIASRLTPRSGDRRLRPPVVWRPALAVAVLAMVVTAAVIWGPSLLPGDSAVVTPPGLTAADTVAPDAALPAAYSALDTTVQAQIAAAWDNPLADKAALGLAMISLETAVAAPEVVN